MAQASGTWSVDSFWSEDGGDEGLSGTSQGWWLAEMNRGSGVHSPDLGPLVSEAPSSRSPGHGWPRSGDRRVVSFVRALRVCPARCTPDVLEPILLLWLSLVHTP